jgi:glycosyltransferase involved in cell wall biosynthesis
VPDRPLRVGILTSARSWRGSGVSFSQIARGVVAAGGHARFFTSARAVTLRLAADGIPCTELPVGRTSLRAARRLRRALGEHAIDVLLVDKRRDLLHGAWGVLGTRIALVNRYNYPGWAVPTDPLTRLAYRRVDLTNFLSQNGVDHARRHAPFVLQAPHNVIHEGVDPERFRPDAGAGAAFRERSGLGGGPLVVGVGALEVEKRYHMLIEAMGRLPRPTPTLLLIGSGSQTDALAARAKLLGLDLRLPGAIPLEDLAAAYAAATIFAHPSTMETFGLTVAEAMACGCPVVGVAAGSVPEVVGDAGVVVPPDDPVAFGSALAGLLANVDRRRELGAQARTRVLERFTLQRMQTAHADALARVAAVRGR